MKIAVLPARGGSKRIPRKNIKQFCGKPVIAWSIEAAKRAKCFDAIIVSTDDEEIAGIAKEYGAEVPFVRPKELSDDFTGTISVIKHAICWIEKNRGKIDLACCIYATAPFVQSGDIKNGLDLLLAKDAPYVFSTTRYPFPIQRALKINQQGYVEMFNPENYSTRSQDLTEAFHDAGQFYWGKPDSWLNELPIFNSKSYPIILPSYMVQDIDTLEDWERAEMLFKVMKGAGK